MKVLEGFEWEQFVKCTIAMTNTGLKPHPGMAREYVDDFLEGAISETDHDSIWKGETPVRSEAYQCVAHTQAGCDFLAKRLFAIVYCTSQVCTSATDTAKEEMGS